MRFDGTQQGSPLTFQLGIAVIADRKERSGRRLALQKRYVPNLSTFRPTSRAGGTRRIFCM